MVPATCVPCQSAPSGPTVASLCAEVPAMHVVDVAVPVVVLAGQSIGFSLG